MRRVVASILGWWVEASTPPPLPSSPKAPNDYMLIAFCSGVRSGSNQTCSMPTPSTNIRGYRCVCPSPGCQEFDLRSLLPCAKWEVPCRLPLFARSSPPTSTPTVDPPDAPHGSCTH